MIRRPSPLQSLALGSWALLLLALFLGRRRNGG